MLGWVRRRRAARAALRDEACRTLDLFGFGEAFELVVGAKAKAIRREDSGADAHFTRLRWAVGREDGRGTKLLARTPWRPGWTPATPQLSADRRKLAVRLAIV